MKCRVVLTSLAEEDIKETHLYYNSISINLANQLIVRFIEARDFLCVSPLSFPVKYKVVRMLLLKQFPYHIHYIIDNSLRQVIIIAIIHAYKKPKNYLER